MTDLFSFRLGITYSCIAPLVLGFTAVGLYLFYFAYRYNLLYVSNADIDTQGKAYPRALQHTTVGCYLLIVCLIGLFAIGTAHDRLALGPLILMIIFLVFTILFHVSLNQAIDPLINYLPKNLEAEEEALLAQERSTKLDQDSSEYQPKGIAPTTSAQNDDQIDIDQRDDSVDSAEKGLTSTSSATPIQRHKEANFIMKYLRPDRYADYATLRRLVLHATDTTSYPPEVERDAYFHPSISAQAPLLWIPRDEAGVSRQEVKHTSRVISITDEDAWLDSKNKVHWDMDKGTPPIYEEKIYY